MKLIVGLGNPGKEYEGTRHNIGFFIVEEIKNQILNSKHETLNNDQNSKFKYENKFQAEVCKIGEVLFAKPQTFMNRSGQAVQAIAHYYVIQAEDIYVIHDDLDIELGSYKIVQAKGPKIHNGLNSIEQALGTKGFWRVRVGVDSRTPEERAVWRGRDYVLAKFTQEENATLNQVVSEICDQLQTI